MFLNKDLIESISITGPIMDKDDRWIVEHVSGLVTKYAGKHVAVGESGTEVEAEARKIYPDKIPSVLRVPREEDLLLSHLPELHRNTIY